MLVHAGITVGSEEAAGIIFENLFGFKKLYAFHIEPEILNALFGYDRAAEVCVYDMGNARLEVFIIAEIPVKPAWFDHLCISVSDMEATIRRAESSGFEIRRYRRETGEVVFIVDSFGNLYELKAS
ncbi:VOC family protein [bacterium]|nr:VOC family protein [candidate division CSSED10-310 bacterium]